MGSAQREPGAADVLTLADDDVSAGQEALEPSSQDAGPGRSDELRAGDVADRCGGEQLVIHGRRPPAASAWQNAQQSTGESGNE